MLCSCAEGFCLEKNLLVSFIAFTVWEYPAAIPHEVMKKQKVMSIVIFLKKV